MEKSSGSSKKVNVGVTLLVITGIIFHLLYLLSMFDIYFRTPLVHGMTPQYPTIDPPAKRLVLISADGLRADKFFELDYNTGKSRAPFLRDIIQNHGSWGVSHTRVPTESRPGHVAIIAGFYEDVSAVTKGWKHNPVEFDSVFNESRHTWSWGSPDILPMFGDHVSHVEMDMYDPYMENFANDASRLDTWVLERVERLFSKATTDPKLNKLMNGDKIVFFLHLLGLDTNGHARRPMSQEYYDNIRLVDSGTKKIYEMIESFYNHDQKTAYIFTSDHGMANKGSHGDGEKANTETPFVAWGAGVSKPIQREDVYTEPTPPEWSLDHLTRVDILQADIAPLMSTLIGVPPPLNSVGVLPTHFLAGGDDIQSKSLFTNAKQILSQFKRKSELKKASSIWFKPYTPLKNSDQFVSKIEKLINAGEYIEAEKECSELIDLAVNGLNYFQTYDWMFLMTVICTGYVGWLMVVVQFILKNYTTVGTQYTKLVQPNEPKRNSKINAVNTLAITLFGVLTTYLILQSSPILYYIYCYFPIVFWSLVFHESKFWGFVFQSVNSKDILGLIAFGLFVISILEMMVVGYFHRWIFSVCFLFFGLWPFVSHLRTSTALNLSWLAACCITALFPLLPVDFGASAPMVAAGGLLISILGSMYYRNRYSTFTAIDKRSLLFKLVAVFVATVVTYDTETHLNNKIGLPLINQIVSWIILTGSFVQLVLYSPSNSVDFLVSLILTLAAPYIMLSISFEVMFYCFLCVTLLLWTRMEEQRKVDSSTGVIGLQYQDVRSALFYLFFYYVAFFGTGNVASISSFEISSTYRFTTVFSPFLMTALLIWKILIPFLLVACVYGIINRKLRISESGALFLIVALSELMTINFFFLVQDYGSWKEIGTSISHFILASLVIVAQLVLGGLSRLLLKNVALKKATTHEQ